MAIITNMNHVHQSRTIKPRYARTQATPQAWMLDHTWDTADGDIFPGSCMKRIGGGEVSLCGASDIPFGLCGNWIAPVFGIDEVTGDGNWDVAVWVLGNDAVMAVSAPAFDTTAAWATAKTTLASGERVFLKPNAKGLLTIASGEGEYVFELVDVEDASTILVTGCSAVVSA